ncbi:glycosyltransferase family 61 protein [Roseitranquillus sediminis]|uniref:glycosyltransferase family 61 protein n=1 Tax=Roseitranquillus sediminis TaxID=2809051 RepID=UPI001D0CDC02|nr:glycosyltransferase 61 family protein [Roseitranquillus sediminis]MBM9593906.1 DUF563 domain-containing protein [Roseitranquillus sediminis]
MEPQIEQFPAADEPLRYRVYEDALVVPTANRGVYRGIDGAAFDAEGRLIGNSLLTRTWGGGPVAQAPAIAGLDRDALPVVEAPHVYGGPFFHHFGHFLLESLARGWVVDELGPMPFVWISGGPPARWQDEILGMAGLTGGHLFPDGPVRVRRLIVPEIGHRIAGQVHPRHAEFLARQEPPAEDYGRIWLSRSGTTPNRRSKGEPAIEDVLAARGWRIVAPERHSVQEQLSMLAHAEVVAGLQGSAFHAAVLLRAPHARFILLRHDHTRDFDVIAAMRGICQVSLFGVRRIVERKEPALHRPRDWARIVDALAGDLARAESAEARDAVRRDYEARYSFEAWIARQRWHLLARARAGFRHNLLRRVRRRIRLLRQG